MTPVQSLIRLCAGLEFLFYATAVTVLTYFSLDYLPAPGLGEQRDRAYYLLLPILFEVSYLVAIGITWSLRRYRTDSAVSEDSTTLVNLMLNLLPFFAGCLALVSVEYLNWASLRLFGVAIVLQIGWRYIPQGWFRRLLECIVGVAVVCVFMKTQMLSADKDAHNWSFYLGPLYSFRENGVLLWDTPSQYGFLNIILAAGLAKFLPLSEVDAFAMLMYLFQIFVVGIMAYFFTTRTRFNPILSVIFACVLLFVYPGAMPSLKGPAGFPSVTGLRFLPSLLALITYHYACEKPSKYKTLTAALLIAAACLWSAESLSYTVIPLCLFLVFKIGLERDLWLFTKPAFLSFFWAVLFVALFLLGYQVVFDTRIDPLAFFDYARIYSIDSGTLPIKIDYVTMLFQFLIGTCYFFTRTGITLRKNKNLSALLFFGYLFCCATYFIARSHPNNALNLVPWFMIALVLSSPSPHASQLLRLHRVGIFVVCLLMVNHAYYALLNQSIAGKVHARFYSSDFWRRPVFPELPQEVKAFIQDKLSGEPLTVVDMEALVEPLQDDPVRGFRLGISPGLHFSQLYKEQRSEYIKRMLEKTPHSYIALSLRDRDIENGIRRLILADSLTTLKEVQAFEGWKILEVGKR